MYDELVKEVQLLKLDESSKVSEVNQLKDHDDHEAAAVAELVNVMTAAEQQTPRQQDNLQIADVELVETGVDGDDDDDIEDEQVEVGQDEQQIKVDVGVGVQNKAEVEAVVIKDTVEYSEYQGNGERFTMSNSKSQQISSKPVIINDADHHTSL